MKVSVVIPVYNEEKYITNCLQNLQNQDVKADEIILVDNNCTDKTIRLARKFKVKTIKEKKQGIARARNKGFNTARYDIIARCDADTVVFPDWIKRIKQNFVRHEIDALTGPAFYYDLTFKTTFYFIAVLDLIKLALGGKETLNGSNMAISKNMWEKVQPEVCLDDSKVHEDLDLAVHVHKAGGIIRRDNSLVVGVSARRMKNSPFSAFGEYPLRAVKTLLNNHSRSPGGNKQRR